VLVFRKVGVSMEGSSASSAQRGTPTSTATTLEPVPQTVGCIWQQVPLSSVGTSRASCQCDRATVALLSSMRVNADASNLAHAPPRAQLVPLSHQVQTMVTVPIALGQR
jgi:hypothetical protein